MKMEPNNTTDDSGQKSNQKSLSEAYPHMRFTVCKKTAEELDVNNNWIRRLQAYFKRKG